MWTCTPPGWPAAARPASRVGCKSTFFFAHVRRKSVGISQIQSCYNPYIIITSARASHHRGIYDLRAAPPTILGNPPL